MGRSIASSGDRRFPKGERKALWCARRRIPPAPVGLDAPTPAREKGLQPYGALTLFFRWRKKSVQKKASGTATPGKSPLLPILTAGLAMSRAAELARLRLPSCALGARLFPPSKWAGLFPSAAYRRSAPPQLAVGILTPLRGFCFRHSGCGAVLPLAGEWDSDAWPILEGHRPAGLGVRAMRPVAEWRSESATRQGAAPDPRAARPVAERR